MDRFETQTLYHFHNSYSRLLVPLLHSPGPGCVGWLGNWTAGPMVTKDLTTQWWHVQWIVGLPISSMLWKAGEQCSHIWCVVLFQGHASRNCQAFWTIHSRIHTSSLPLTAFSCQPQVHSQFRAKGHRNKLVSWGNRGRKFQQPLNNLFFLEILLVSTKS